MDAEAEVDAEAEAEVNEVGTGSANAEVIGRGLQSPTSMWTSMQSQKKNHLSQNLHQDDRKQPGRRTVRRQ